MRWLQLGLPTGLRARRGHLPGYPNLPRCLASAQVRLPAAAARSVVVGSDFLHACEQDTANTPAAAILPGRGLSSAKLAWQRRQLAPLASAGRRRSATGRTGGGGGNRPAESLANVEA